MASLNAGPEYYVAEQKYREAVGYEEQMLYLREMLKFCPKHKGAHSILNEIKTKMARLRKENEKEKAKKRSRKSKGDFLKRQGGAQVCILGFVNSGKSALVNALTNADFTSTRAPFETAVATPAMMKYKKAQIQLVDTPSVHGGNKSLLFAMARNADMALIIIDESQGVKEQEEFFSKLRCKRRFMAYSKKDLVERANSLKKELYEALELIRVFTKVPRGKVDKLRPIVLFKNARTVREVARQVHKDFYRNLKCARVWGSSRFDGQQVAPNYKLEDGDVIELQLK